MVATQSFPESQTNDTEPLISLRGVSWQTYQALMADVGDDRAWRIAYERGVLELRMPLSQHEEPKRLIESFVEAFADELEIEIRSLGALTLEREDLNRAIEPDTCFYIQNELRVRGKDRIRLPEDPPPDLAIESDYTHSSLNKFSIYAALGVPELWRYRDRGSDLPSAARALQIYQLIEGDYQLVQTSLAFPALPVAEIPDFIQQSKTMGQRTAVRAFKKRVREIQ